MAQTLLVVSGWRKCVALRARTGLRYALPMSPDTPSSWPARLEALGWFRLVDAAAAEEAKRAIVARPYVLAGEVKRRFHADAEELAEGGIMNFLGTVLSFLRAEGVAAEVTIGRWKRPAGGPAIDPDATPGPVLSLRVASERGGPLVEVKSKHSEDAYAVYVGEREFVAWQASDDPVEMWTGATRATLDILNFLPCGT